MSNYICTASALCIGNNKAWSHEWAYVSYQTWTAWKVCDTNGDRGKHVASTLDLTALMQHIFKELHGVPSGDRSPLYGARYIHATSGQYLISPECPACITLPSLCLAPFMVRQLSSFQRGTQHISGGIRGLFAMWPMWSTLASTAGAQCPCPNTPIIRDTQNFAGVSCPLSTYYLSFHL